MVLDVYLQNFFESYSPIIVRRWLYFMTIPILLTGFLSLGLFRIHELKNLNAEDVHTPDDAPSKFEKSVINQLWPLKVDEFLPQRSFNYDKFLMVLITAEDCSKDSKYRPECNLLSTIWGTNRTYIELVEDLESELANNITVVDEFDKSRPSTHSDDTISYTYDDLCLSWWGHCVRTDTLIRMLIKRETLRDAGISITYPRANTHATPIYLAFNLGGVTTHQNSTEILSVASIRLTYFLRSDTLKLDRLSASWQNAAAEYLDEFERMGQKNLDVTYYHSQSIEQGLQRQNAKVFPKFALAIILLLVFSTMCCVRWKRRGLIPCVDFITSKTTLAGVGVLTALMGIGSGFGVLMLCGIARSGLTVVVPFLIISIGVDDMFILVAAWHESNGLGRTLVERMTLTLKEAAVSITITSVTDALSFMVGSFSAIPSVRWFCMYASTCIMFNYIYQITFFVSAMVLYATWEMQSRNSFAPCAKARQTEPSCIVHPTVQKNGYLKHIPPVFPVKKETEQNVDGAAFFAQYYGPALLHPITKPLVVIMLAAYLTISIYGCTRLKEGMNIDDLLLKSDPVIAYTDMASMYFKDGWQAEIIVTKPPDMTLKKNRDAVLLMVEEFEKSMYSIGPNGTQFWLRNYMDYLNATETYIVDNSSDQWLDGPFKFVHMFSFQKAWKQDLAWEEHAETLFMKAFRFRIGLSFEWEHPYTQTLVVDDLRRIANKYDQWGVVTYGGYIWTHVDQYKTVLPTTLQNVAIALVCMLVVSLALIPRVVCTLWITLTIVSIDVGVVGFMTLWGISLSQISMITIIMSIGFSVDFAAHITYGYVACSVDSERQRIIIALQRLGWPLFQAGISTVLGVSVLATVESAMVLVFLKTILLVIIFGMLHALVFLPVMLTVVMPLLTTITVSRAQWSNRISQKLSEINLVSNNSSNGSSSASSLGGKD